MIVIHNNLFSQKYRTSKLFTCCTDAALIRLNAFFKVTDDQHM